MGWAEFRVARWPDNACGLAGRLIKLERHQAEYWVLSLMLAGLKSQGGSMIDRGDRSYRYDRGFFADGLLEALAALPDYPWHPARRKRTYLNHVLARAEEERGYKPARCRALGVADACCRLSDGHFADRPSIKSARQADQVIAHVI